LDRRGQWVSKIVLSRQEGEENKGYRVRDTQNAMGLGERKGKGNSGYGE
jgi:hypothetical protein